MIIHDAAWRKAMLLTMLMLIVALPGCMRVTDGSGQVLDIGKDDQGYYVERVLAEKTVTRNILRAMVKGSIYESGEAVSVFGTCLDASDRPFPDTVAMLSSWYPNGTAHLVNHSMNEFREGYYVYEGPMASVGGTYLTELRCVHTPTGVYANAYGEWQNPVWVSRIAQIQNQTDNISIDINDTRINQKLDNITIQIGDLRVDVNESFEITFDKLDGLNWTLNETFVNLSEQIRWAAQIANSSVDRNESYLATLLLQIYGMMDPGSGSALLAPGWDESWTSPIYRWSEWELRVDVYDPNNNNATVMYPDVFCWVNTTQTPLQQSMSPQGNHFVYSEEVTQSGEFLWTVDCQWI